MFLLFWLLLLAVPLICLGSFFVICLMGLAELSEAFKRSCELSDSDTRFLRSCGIRSAEDRAASLEENESCDHVYSPR